MKKIISIVILLSYIFTLCSCDLFTIKTHNHSFGKWRTVKAPSCTVDGLKRRLCECGEIENEVIKATDHKFSTWETVIAPTYSIAGSETRICECGASETRTLPVLTILFEDNFDGNTIDNTKWKKCPEWVRHDGINVWENDLSYLDGEGHLVLRVEWDEETQMIKSGAIRSMGLFESGYGYYEASIKFPVVEGVWGAFWLMCGDMSIVNGSAADGVEIDVIESIRNELGMCNSALHYDGYGKDLKSLTSGSHIYNIYDGEFHTFALERSEHGYTFYIDGIVTWDVSPRECAPCPENGYMELTLEAAKSAGGGNENCLSALPAEMLVDYVRVYPTNPYK